MQTSQQSDQKLVCILLLVALEQRTQPSDGLEEGGGEDGLPGLGPALAVGVAELLEQVMECLDHVQKTLLLRVPLLRLGVQTHQVLVKVVETVTEARGEPQRVEDRVEEAGVAQVGETRHAHTPLCPAPSVHGAHTGALTTRGNRWHANKIWAATIRSC